MVRFVKNTEDILMDLQADEDFTTQAWQECLEVTNFGGRIPASSGAAFPRCCRMQPPSAAEQHLNQRPTPIALSLTAADSWLPAWHVLLQALVEAITEIAGLLDICARYNVIRACMSAGEVNPGRAVDTAHQLPVCMSSHSSCTDAHGLPSKSCSRPAA